MYIAHEVIQRGDWFPAEEDFRLTESEMQELGHWLIFIINADTMDGFDQAGNMFVPYSESYARKRARRGRNTSPVDLTWTGQMLNSMSSKTDGSSVTLFFNDSESGRIANFHNSLEPRKKIPLRRFFAADAGTQRAEDMHRQAELIWGRRDRG